MEARAFSEHLAMSFLSETTGLNSLSQTSLGMKFCITPARPKLGTLVCIRFRPWCRFKPQSEVSRALDLEEDCVAMSVADAVISNRCGCA
jgi:hypothetical protein